MNNKTPPTITSPILNQYVFGEIKPKDIIVNAIPTLHILKKALKGFIPNLVKSGLAIIPSGIRYKPRPKAIAIIETLSQFSLTIDAAINTAPQTGGVMVESKANQKTKRWACKGSKPSEINAGPETEMQIT